MDYKPFETWLEEGAHDTMALASASVKKQLSNYEKPFIDPAIEEQLFDFVRIKKESEPDSFV